QSREFGDLRRTGHPGPGHCLNSLHMSRVELGRKSTEHLLVWTAAIIGFDEFRLTFEIAGADVFADRAARGRELRKRGRQWFDAKAGPFHRPFKEEGVA